MVCTTVQAETTASVKLENFVTLVQIPAVTLLDQHGNPQALQSLFADKVVVVDFVFTSCRSICPIITAVMKRIYKLLEHYLGDSLILISITLDPAHDTPEKLAEFAAKWGDKPDWLWLTGNSVDIAQVLKAFTINPNDAPESHPPLMFVGKGDHWFKWVGLPDAQTVAQTAIQLTQTKQP